MPVFATSRRLSQDERITVCLRAEALSRKTEPGKGYGLLTRKFLDVLEVLMRLGVPATEEAIAIRAGCSEDTVFAAIKALQTAGILTIEAQGRFSRTITFAVPEAAVLPSRRVGVGSAER